MKKSSLKLLCSALAFIITCSVNAFSQNVRNEYKLGKFTDLEVSDDFDVTVVKGSEYTLELTVPEAYVHSYDIDPHSYDVDPLEEGIAFKEQSLFACKQAAA